MSLRFADLSCNVFRFYQTQFTLTRSRIETQDCLKATAEKARTWVVSYCQMEMRRPYTESDNYMGSFRHDFRKKLREHLKPVPSNTTQAPNSSPVNPTYMAEVNDDDEHKR